MLRHDLTVLHARITEAMAQKNHVFIVITYSHDTHQRMLKEPSNNGECKTNETEATYSTDSDIDCRVFDDSTGKWCMANGCDIGCGHISDRSIGINEPIEIHHPRATQSNLEAP